MKYLLYLSLLIFVGCASDPEIEYVKVPVFSPVVCEDFGRIEGVRALPVVFVNAKTEDNLQVLGLDGSMYSNLSIIIKDSLRYIREQQEAINYYEGCIENHNSVGLNEEAPE